MLFCILSVDFRNHERNIRIHSKNGRIIDRGCARFSRNRHELSGSFSARAEKCDVDLVERIFAEFFHGDCLVAKFDFPASGFSGREGANFRCRKMSPFQNPQQLGANRAGRAYDRDVIFFFHRGEL